MKDYEKEIEKIHEEEKYPKRSYFLYTLGMLCSLAFLCIIVYNMIK